MIYSENRDVWENLPRGCALLRVATPARRQLLWGVRANRKFTGQEDEAAGAEASYRIEGPPAQHVVVALKENGQASHLGVRRVAVNGRAERVVVVGSKHVHLAVAWTPDLAEFRRRVSLFEPAARYELAREMALTLHPLLTEEVLALLERNRLVLNSEYVVPVGSGPINNLLLHGMAAGDSPAHFAFSLVANQWRRVPAGMALCVDPVFALRSLAALGLRTVRWFVVAASLVPEVRQRVAALPGAEGAVLYYANAEGVVMLEKAKAVSYVVVRAVREKVRGFLAGRRPMPGCIDAWKEVRDDTARFEWARAAAGGRWALRAPSPQSAALAERALRNSVPGLVRQDAQLLWPPPAGSDPPLAADAARALVLEARRRVLGEQLVPHWQEIVARRIGEIDHVPMSAEERARWVADGRAFIAWIFDRVTAAGWTQDRVLEGFSELWTLFRADEAAEKGQQPPKAAPS